MFLVPAAAVLFVCYSHLCKMNIYFLFDLLLNNLVTHKKGKSSTDILHIRSKFVLTRKQVYQAGNQTKELLLIYTLSVSFLFLWGHSVVCVCELICMHGVVPRTDLTLGYLTSPLASLSHTE